MEFIKDLLPTLATALGGPLAGGAVKFFADKLGLSEATKDAVLNAVKGATPEQLVEMKKIDAELKAQYIAANVKLEEIAAADRNSARQANVSSGVNKFLFWMSILLLSLAFGAELRVLFYGYPKDIVDAVLVGRILGLLDSVALQIMNYWYGTTSSSAHKTQLLAQADPIKGKE